MIQSEEITYQKLKQNRNLEMERAVLFGKAINLAGMAQTKNGDYVLDSYFEPNNKTFDYCDLSRQEWIWSIGQHRITKQVIASISQKFSNDEDFECVWLR